MRYVIGSATLPRILVASRPATHRSPGALDGRRCGYDDGDCPRPGTGGSGDDDDEGDHDGHHEAAWMVPERDFFIGVGHSGKPWSCCPVRKRI